MPLRFALGVLVLVGMLVLSGCEFFFPSRPTWSPVSLNIDEGKVRVVSCLPSIDVSSVRVDYRTEGAEYSTVMDPVEDDSTSGGILEEGDSFVIGEQLGTLRFRTLASLPTDVVFQDLSLRMGYTEDGEVGYTWPMFRDVDPSRLAADDYVYSDGRLSKDPCGMVE